MRNLKNKLILRKPQGFADKYPLISVYSAFFGSMYVGYKLVSYFG